VLPPEVPQAWVPVRGSADGIVYEPALLGVASLRFENAKAGVREERKLVIAAPIPGGPAAIDWGDGRALEIDPADLDDGPADGAGFGDPPAEAADPKSYRAWEKAFGDWVYREQELTIWKSPGSGLHSRPDEDERAFRIRLQQAAREGRDEAADALRARWEKRIAAAEARLRTATAAVGREADQAKHENLQTAISVGATVLGSVFGGRLGRSTLGRATTAARGASRSMRQAEDVERAKEKEALARREVEELEAEFRRELAEHERKTDPSSEALESVVVRPRRKDVATELVALGWLPWRTAESGEATPAW
jgi:hypothetical protein